MHCDERSTRQVPFRHYCDTLRWTLHDRRRYRQISDGTTFLLTVIDVFSKVASCVPLKNKFVASLVTARESTFTKGWPMTYQTNKGLKFLNRSIQALLKKYSIHHFFTQKETKASIVERFNQTWRYIDILQDFVRSYKDTPTAASVTAVRACPSSQRWIACASASLRDC